MSDDETPPAVFAAIAAVIADLPAIGKDDRISEGPQKYAYRGIETIKAELKPVLAKHGVFYAPHRVRVTDDATYDTKSGATWQRLRHTITFRFYGPDGSFIEAEGRGEGADNSDKACSKAHTNAEKQVLLQVFCIADSEDPDHHRPPEATAPAAALLEFTPAQAKGRIVESLRVHMTKADAIAKAAVLWENHGPKGDGPFTEADLTAVLADVEQVVTEQQASF